MSTCCHFHRSWTGWLLVLAGLVLMAFPPSALAMPRAQTPTPTSTPAGPTYTVQPGDTLAGIAERFNVDLEALMTLNGITDPTRIYPGMTLHLPGLPGVQGELTTVPIGWCEDLWSLARRYRIAPELLARLNRLVTPTHLYPGRDLILPKTQEEAPRMGRYLVGREETLLEIAVRTGQNPWLLALVNHLPGPWAAQTGDVLLYPDEHGTTDLGACPPQVKALTLQPKELVQGEAWALFWTLAPKGSVTRVEATWRERPMVFHLLRDEPSPSLSPEDAETSTVDARDIWVGLQGVHAMLRPQVYPLEVAFAFADGRQWRFQQPVNVQPANFLFEELTVPPEFLDPTAVQKENAQIQELMSTLTQPRRWDGPFHSPIENGAQCVTSLFGTRRKYNDGQAWGYHAGVDFCAGEGTPIYAPAPGRVVLARSLTIRGKAVVLDHGWGVYTGYWHMSKIAVQEGETVAPGDLLGYVGGTGRVTGPHLHWELWVGGVPVNPMTWLENPPFP